jgi:hypothetical protein
MNTTRQEDQMRYMMIMIPNVTEENWTPDVEAIAMAFGPAAGLELVEFRHAAAQTRNDRERTLLLERAGACDNPA